MKELFKIFTIALLSISLFSCSSDDDNNDGKDDGNDDKDEITVDSETISAKWISDDTNSLFKSFEFHKDGNYIAVRNLVEKAATGDETLFTSGTYQIKDQSTITLEGLGTIKINEISETEFSFVVMLNADPSREISFTGKRGADVAESTRTDLLCRSWEIVKYNDETVVGTEYENSIVIFSKAGTYLVAHPNNDDFEGGLARWQWKAGSNETEIQYAWEDDVFGKDFMTINELTKDYLKVTEAFDKTDIDVFELVPATTVKSARTVSNIRNGNKANSIFGIRK